MLASNEKEASQLAVELTSLREMLLEERQDLQGSKYVKVLQVSPQHQFIKPDAGTLSRFTLPFRLDHALSQVHVACG